METWEERPMTGEEDRTKEGEIRDLAEKGRGQVVEGSGQAIEGRSMPQMVSLRLEATLLHDLREVAERRGLTLSEVLREGAGLLIERERRVPVWLRILVIRTALGEQPRDVPPSRATFSGTSVVQISA
jgi:predicted DNA-binding ribbon-helix-helix protein